MKIVDFNKRQSAMLDALRIFAAVWVYLIHLDQWTTLLPEFIKPFAWKGAYGVTIFFVLSGLLVFRSACTNKPGSFYFKRIVRIVPLYYSLIIGLIVINGWLMVAVHPDQAKLGWVRYFLFGQGILPSTDFASWNNVFGLWSLSTFAVFYLLAPLLARLLRGLWQAELALVGAMLLAKYSGVILGAIPGLAEYQDSFGAYVYFSPLNNLWPFLAGIVLYMALANNQMPWGLAGFAVLAMFFPQWWSQLCFCAFIGLLIWKPLPLEKGGRVLKECGAWTFALYLAHPVVLAQLSYMMVWYGWSHQFTYCLMLLLPFLLAAAAYYIVERPAARLLTRWCRSLHSRS